MLCGGSCKQGPREVGGRRRMTSDPADRLILSFQRPPLSLLFTSLKECRGGVKKEQAGIMKLVLEGVEEGEEKGEDRQSKG